MQVTSLVCTNGNWTPASQSADLVMAFISPDLVDGDAAFEALRAAYPHAAVIGCTTGGEIAGGDALETSAVATAVSFEDTRIRLARTQVADAAGSFVAGAELAAALAGPDLTAVFVLADGVHVNGSALIAGLTGTLPAHVSITGGLAGDADRFAKTRVGANGPLQERAIGAIGFYGDSLTVGCGSAGGWDGFGPRRRITRSEGNVLFELDGQPALDLYKHYLGAEADGLPGSALLFPLMITTPTGTDEDGLVRTIVGVNEEAKSLIFAGDVPQGHTARLMTGSIDRLVDGAETAARTAHSAAPNGELAVLVSCIGRRLLMGQRAWEEVDAAHRQASGATQIGFYSYGEICPHATDGFSALHNQTMTITVFSEARRAG